MHTLLINAHPNPHAPASFSNRLLHHLHTRLPAHSTQRLALYESAIPELDAEMMEISRRRRAGEALNDRQQASAARSAELLAQFKAAQRVVISLPLHNFNVPARLKSYVDNIAVPGQTFRYTAHGQVQGLMNDGRKLLVIQASGSVCSGRHAQQGAEPSIAFLQTVFQEFMGFDGFELLRAEGTQTAGLDPEQILAEAKQRLDALLPAFLAA